MAQFLACKTDYGLHASGDAMFPLGWSAIFEWHSLAMCSTSHKQNM